MNNTNKAILAIATSLTLCFSTSAFADHKRHTHKQKNHVRYAKVIHVKPIYKKVRVSYPEQHCWREEVKKPVKRRVNHSSPEAVVLGGFIGGVIGHELGKNNNPEAATVAGAIIGSTLVYNANTRYYRTGEYRIKHRRHCRTDNHYRTERQLKGYRVTYRFKGELYTTRMKHYPGKRIPVNVEVTPKRRRY